MKKAMIKYLLVAVLAVVGSQAAFSQYYTLNAIAMCWTTPGGVDSTIYMSQTDASQKTKPDRLYYYNASGVKVTPSGGSLSFGPCGSPTTDSIIVRLNVLVTDMDTVINLLHIIAQGRNGHVVTEPGCLVLNDTSGCPVTGLRADISALPAGWKQVYLNDTTYLGAAQVSSCSNFAAALNLIQGTDIWSCCNDSLVVESLDTSDYHHLTFISSVTGDTIIRMFADTTGPGFTSQTLPVEIIKVIDSTGLITDLRVFSSDGQIEYTGQGTVTVGPCLPSETYQFYQSVTAQLNSIVTLLGGDCQLEDQVALSSITTTTTYNANTLNSISILPISGTITVNTGGGAVTLQNGTEYWFGAEGCHYIQTQIVVGVTSGTAQVSRYY